MVRSLYAGISGLRTHQVGLDVTANNIANVNTVAFKAGRATFKESMVQMLEGPSRPAGNAGGKNPMQIGLGVGVGSIDTMLRQGNFQTTGQITDLALEGRAYFAFSSGNGVFYSRNGGLQMDAEGRLVSPTNGYRLQGKMADVNGEYGPNTMIGDIRIPWGDKAPARATDVMTFSCNLNSDSQALGTVTHTNRFLASANVLDGVDPHGDIMRSRGRLTDLFDENGNSLGIREGDVLTFRLTDGTTHRFPVERYNVNIHEDPADPTSPIIRTERQIPTLEDLRAQLEVFLNSTHGSGTDITVAIDSNGRLNITNNSGEAINGLQINSSRPGSNSFVTNAFLFPRTIGDGQTGYTPNLRVPAVETDALANLFDQSGRSLGFSNGDTININGMVGGRNRSADDLIFYDGSGVNPATTMRDLMEAIANVFSLPSTDGTMYNRPSVSMRDSSELVSDGIPLGAIVVRGQPEVAFALTGLSIMGVQADPNQADSPTRFNTNMTFTQSQAARNTGIWTTSTIVYDDAGGQHNVSMTFTHSGTPGVWLWEASMNGSDAVILGGNRGRITFGLDGSPSSFSFDDNSHEFSFDPRNGASQVNVKLDVGTPGSLLGITQFESNSTTAVSANGYGMGKLQEISISETGEISGIYTNGISKSIAQIYVAEFNNPAGLMKVSDSMLAVSNNSGEATLYQPGIGSTTRVKPGALEMSNVELETEFTNMITIQRGYQASARVISTSDQMLQELVQLVR